MLKKNHYALAGIGAAAVAVLSIGGYLLHRKFLKRRLQEQARKQAMFGFNDDDDLFDDEGFYKYDDDDYSDGEGSDDYINTLMQDLKEENDA